MKKLSALPSEALILMLGGLLRIAGLNASAIWYDEAFTVNMAKLPLRQMLAQQWIEYSPPLWNLLMRPFAYGPVWFVRLPALLCSLASLWVVYKLMAKLGFNPWQRNLSAALVAFFPSLIWTAQDARVYALLSLLFLLAFWAALDGKWRALGVLSVLMLYAHNTAPFLLVPVYFIALTQHIKEYRQIATAGTLSLLAFLPWLPSIIGRTSSFWLGEFQGGDALLQMVFAVWVGSLPGDYLGLIFVLFAVALWAWTLYRIFKNGALEYITPVFMILTLLPLFLLALYSSLVQNAFFYRPLIALVIPFALWMGSLVPRNWKAASLVTLVWVLLLGFGVANYSPQTKGARLDNAANYIRTHWQQGDVIYYTTGTVALPFDYYLRDLPHRLMDMEHNTGLMQLSHAHAFGIPVGELLAPCPCNEIERAWLIIPNDPLLSDEARAQLAPLIQNAEQIGFIDYSQAADVAIWLVE